MFNVFEEPMTLLRDQKEKEKEEKKGGGEQAAKEKTKAFK